MLSVEFSHHLFTRTVHADAASAHNQQAIELRQDGRAVSNDKDGRTRGFHMLDRLG